MSATTKQEAFFEARRARRIKALNARIQILCAALRDIADYRAVNEMTAAPATPVAPLRMKAIARKALASFPTPTEAR